MTSPIFTGAEDFKAIDRNAKPGLVSRIGGHRQHAMNSAKDSMLFLLPNLTVDFKCGAGFML